MIFIPPRIMPITDTTQTDELRNQLDEKEKVILQQARTIDNLIGEINVKVNYIEQLEKRISKQKQEYDAVNAELNAIKKILSH
jgi:vacuolar-type H+-ATPase subunit I/STV1